MASRQELLALHQFHLVEAESMKKHVASRTYHALMAQMYHTLWKDAPPMVDYKVNVNKGHDQ